jgi:HD-like signal output (HDOD) protein
MQLEHSAPADAEDANIAGMLHDIGKLILAEALPRRFQQACDLANQLEMPLHAAELEVFGATHAGVGAYLFGLWGLPASIVEAIAFHHEPVRNNLRAFSPLTAVHVANVLEHELNPAQEPGRPPELDAAYLASLDLEHRLDKWRAEAMRLSLQTDESE